MLQTLLAARDRLPQKSYPKLRDPEPFEGEKAKFKTFLAQCELKFRTEGNRFDDNEKRRDMHPPYSKGWHGTGWKLFSTRKEEST